MGHQLLRYGSRRRSTVSRQTVSNAATPSIAIAGHRDRRYLGHGLTTTGRGNFGAGLREEVFKPFPPEAPMMRTTRMKATQPPDSAVRAISRARSRDIAAGIVHSWQLRHVRAFCSATSAFVCMRCPTRRNTQSCRMFKVDRGSQPAAIRRRLPSAIGTIAVRSAAAYLHHHPIPDGLTRPTTAATPEAPRKRRAIAAASGIRRCDPHLPLTFRAKTKPGLHRPTQPS